MQALKKLSTSPRSLLSVNGKMSLRKGWSTFSVVKECAKTDKHNIGIINYVMLLHCSLSSWMVSKL